MADIDAVRIVGAGTMGAGVAEVAARAGHDVVLCSRSRASADGGGCGLPMGPFGLLDLIGLDTSVAILDTLHAEFGEANYVPATTLRRMVSAGRLGRKTGWGFRRY